MLQTARLHLRQWQETDAPAFAALNADPDVMACFPALLNRQESDEMLSRCRQRIAEQGWGFWAVERRDNHQFIGFVGLNRPRFDAHFTPCIEIGWRLARDAWGQGFASEAARACLQYGFDQQGLTEIVSFTSQHNLRSQAVMQRLGMKRNPADDFLHPNLPVEHRLALHQLYRLSAQDWRSVCLSQ